MHAHPHLLQWLSSTLLLSTRILLPHMRMRSRGKAMPSHVCVSAKKYLKMLPAGTSVQSTLIVEGSGGMPPQEKLRFMHVVAFSEPVAF